MGRKEDEEENEERPVANGEAVAKQARGFFRSAALSQRPRLPVQSPSPCPAGRALLPVWILQLTSLFENLKLPAHRRKASLGSLLSLPTADKAPILPKTPPAARFNRTPKTQSGSEGTAASLGLNAHPRNGIDHGKSCLGIL